MYLSRLFLILFIILPTLAQPQQFYHTGSNQNVDSVPVFGILLAGGATDNDEGMEWLAQRANGGDVVVLRASGSDGYNNYIHSELGVQINSVTTIVIGSHEQANDSVVCRKVADAEMVFIAGGNQWNYYSHWKGSCLQLALHAHVNDKKAPIGGTSAGLAILGEVAYVAQFSSATSDQALNNPYHTDITLANDFLQVPFLEQTVTDSHYDERDRYGRHVVFMARMINDWQMNAKGIGVDEYTAIGVDENGLARVFGNPAYDDYAYFIQSTTRPETCVPDSALHWHGDEKALQVYRVSGTRDGSNTFDLSNWFMGQGGQWFDWFVDRGELIVREADYVNIPSGPILNDTSLFTLYPNPVADTFFIENNTGKTIESYTLFDASGRIQKQYMGGNDRVLRGKVADLPEGIYFLLLYQENKTYRLKLIKE